MIPTTQQIPPQMVNQMMATQMMMGAPQQMVPAPQQMMNVMQMARPGPFPPHMGVPMYPQ